MNLGVLSNRGKVAAIVLAATFGLALAPALSAPTRSHVHNAARVASAASVKPPASTAVNGAEADAENARRLQTMDKQAQMDAAKDARTLAAQKAREDAKQSAWAIAVVASALGAFLLLVAIYVPWLAYGLMKRPDPAPAPAGELPTSIVIPISQLPLGLPEGSIRALLSFFVVFFGLTVIILQDKLGMKSGEAVAGFIGAVITFYFSTRNDAAARQTDAAASAAFAKASSAEKSAQQASDGVKGAQADSRDALQRSATMEERSRLAPVVVAPVANGNAGASATPDDTVLAPLRQARAGLDQLQRTLQLVTSMDVGTGPLGDISGMLNRVIEMTRVIDPLLTGSPDPQKVAEVAAAAAALLKELAPREPIVAAASDALSTIKAASTLNPELSALLGSVGGPAGLVGALLLGGLSLVRDRVQFDRWKAAVIDQPFDLEVLAPDRIDDTMARQILTLAPLAQQQLGSSPELVTELLRAFAVPPGGTPKASTDIVQDLQDAKSPLVAAFESPAALRDAVEEYRAAMVTWTAMSALPTTLSVGPTDGSAAATLPTPAVVRAAALASAEPAAEGAIERLLYLTEALGRDPTAAGSTLIDLVRSRLTAAQAVADTNDAAVVQSNVSDADVTDPRGAT